MKYDLSTLWEVMGLDEDAHRRGKLLQNLNKSTEPAIIHYDGTAEDLNKKMREKNSKLYYRSRNLVANTQAMKTLHQNLRNSVSDAQQNAISNNTSLNNRVNARQQAANQQIQRIQQQTQQKLASARNAIDRKNIQLGATKQIQRLQQAAQRRTNRDINSSPEVKGALNNHNDFIKSQTNMMASAVGAAYDPTSRNIFVNDKVTGNSSNIDSLLDHEKEHARQHATINRIYGKKDGTIKFMDVGASFNPNLSQKENILNYMKNPFEYYANKAGYGRNVTEQERESMARQLFDKNYKLSPGERDISKINAKGGHNVARLTAQKSGLNLPSYSDTMAAFGKPVSVDQIPEEVRKKLGV